LADALGPEVERRKVSPDSRNLTIQGLGFNDRNMDPHQTPCDQDFLRKLARLVFVSLTYASTTMEYFAR
jgi:hypothetical protein